MNARLSATVLMRAPGMIAASRSAVPSGKVRSSGAHASSVGSGWSCRRSAAPSVSRLSIAFSVAIMSARIARSRSGAAQAAVTSSGIPLCVSMPKPSLELRTLAERIACAISQ